MYNAVHHLLGAGTRRHESLESKGEWSNMEIQYKGMVTKKDFLSCILLLNPNLKWQRWFFGIVLCAILFSFIYLWAQGSAETLKPILELGPAGLIPVVFLLFPWRLPYLQLTAYNQRTNIYRSEIFGIINDSEITVNNHEIKANLLWSVY